MGTRTRQRPAVVLVAVWLQLLLAAAFGGLRMAGTDPPLRALDRPGALAMILLYALPGLLGLLAVAGGRPPALWAAAALDLPLAFTALSGVSLLLLVPGVLFAVGAARWTPRPPARPATHWPVGAVVLLGLAAGAALLVLPAADAMFCWSASVDQDGRTTYGRVERRAADPSGGHSLGLAEGGPAGVSQQRGCSTGIVGLPQAALSLTLSAAALAAALLLPRQPGHGGRAARLA